MLPLLAALTIQSSIPDPQWLREKLEEVRAKYKLPALAAALVWEGQVKAASAVGVRKWGDPTPAQRTDAFHLGSVMKTMTATLVAKMVDNKILSWNTTLEIMFPELATTMRPEYRKVTVAQLLAHTSGMPYQPRTPEYETDRESREAPGRRYAYVKAALADPPEAEPGTKMIYGGGHILVSSYLERTLGRPYESLMRKEVFEPLGMTSAGYGDMATPGKVDAPWHHIWKDGAPVPVDPDLSQRIQARSPVGRNGFCSIIDLAKFAAMQLQGARGQSKFLSAASFAQFQKLEPHSSHSVGWVVNPTSWAGGLTLWHNGSIGKNLAVVTMEMKQGFASCVLTNVGDGDTGKACDEVQFWLLDQAKSRYSTISTSYTARSTRWSSYRASTRTRLPIRE
ncbi:MAG: hypothetical protein BGO01_16995 [Armatimonadetes bacterium 55-13]|nr:beta-lactamase family protein [Armatimonadota bacterium]OJU63856.1 MAG: hypothetical protein BGO01_16995 [Armatimonadetes bacterium 55-13]